MVSERSLAVLRVIVEDYIADREPVGSRSIVDRHGFGVSAATIRNDMAQLEEEELIVAPHTSSGRIPTDKGYRVFVDQLADRKPLSGAQRQAIAAFLDSAVDVDDVLARTVRLLSQLTNQVALAQVPSFGGQRGRHVELVALGASRLLTVLITDQGRVDQHFVDVPSASAELDPDFVAELRAKLNAELVGASLGEVRERLERIAAAAAPQRQDLVAAVLAAISQQVADTRQDRLVVAGAANLARTEGDFRGSISPVLDAIEEQVTLLKLFSEMELDEVGVAVRIGRENVGTALEETSVVTAGYAASGAIARLGVVGPTRMDYTNNIAAVRAVARYLSRLLGED